MRHSWMAMGLAALLLASPGVAQTQEYQVVVHEANPSSNVAADEISRMFMKRTTRWADGGSVVPVDLAGNSETRDAFSQAVHGRSVSAIKAYWQRQIFSGRGFPPEEMGSDTAVLAFVRNNPGAIGYVASGTSVGDGVKVLNVN